MKYADGSPVRLGDIVLIPLSDRSAKARIVMLGDTGEHAIEDKAFIDWVQKENLLSVSQVVVEWVGENPFAHNDPKYAPVGNHMFTDLDGDVIRVDA